MLGFGDAVARFYTNYFNFYGRASRAEYWWPALMQLLVYTGLCVVFIIGAAYELDGLMGTIFILGVLFAFVNLIPSYAVAARRFHDLDQTGWLVLVFVIANGLILITWFAQMIWFAMPGTQGRNQYGSDPYANEADVFG